MMKRILLLAVVFMTSISIFGQENKFTYERLSTGSYKVKPVFKEHADENVRTAGGHFEDEAWITSSFDSVIRAAIPEEKLDKLLSKNKKGWIIIDYLTSGQVYSIRFYVEEEYKEILSDQDFYNLYLAIKSFQMDMHKIRMEYPRDYNPETKYIWSVAISFFPTAKK